jgi:hypothetical protein
VSPVRTKTARAVYAAHVKKLSPAERLKLVSLIVEDLSRYYTIEERPRPNIMEFYGAGRALPDGVDAQEYVNQLRGEWEERSRELERRDW